MHCRKQTRRKQKAGYLYTRNAKRGAWVNSLSWSGPQLLNLLKAIPWDSFEYRGEVVHTYDYDENNDAGFRMGAEKELRVIPGVLTHSERPYEVFGGAGCELWSTVFPNPPIRKFVDPSADIDIQILPFKFKVLPTGNRYLNKVYTSQVKHQDAVQEIHIYAKDRYTAFGDAYTKWLFTHIVEYCQSIAKSFQQANLRLPKKANITETAMADMAEAVGSLYITRMCNPEKEHCKIQISTKVQRGTIEEANHLLEFIIPFEQQINEDSIKQFQVRGVFVQEPWALFQGQIKGLRDRGYPYLNFLRDHPEIQRANISKAEFFYKSENHCGRILWLLQICREAEKVRSQGRPVYRQPSTSDLEYVLKQIVEKNLASLCTFSFGEDYIETLFRLADTFQNVRPGTFTDPASPVRHRVLGM